MSGDHHGPDVPPARAPHPPESAVLLIGAREWWVCGCATYNVWTSGTERCPGCGERRPRSGP